MFKREVLQRIIKKNRMEAYKCEDFWQCIDSKRVHGKLINLWVSGPAHWM